MDNQKKSKLSFVLFLTKWLFVIGVGLAFLPITMGLLLGWLVFKKVENKKLKIGLLTAIIIPTLLIGSVWVKAMNSSSSNTTSNPSPSPLAQVSGVETSQTNTSTPQASATPETASDEVRVTRVIDGDTIEIEGGKRLRYIGIDTPEISGNNPDCFGREAYEKNKELVEGNIVRLEKDVSETDRYGRLLRYVYKGDTLINDLLVREGFASAYTYPTDVKYKDRFLEAQAEARNNNKGLWSSCKTATPKPTIKAVSTSQPVQYVAPETKPATNATTSGGSYSCNCSKPCTEISSCSEAQYQLNTCGCNQRDADHDGIACDGAPLNCQN